MSDWKLIALTFRIWLAVALATAGVGFLWHEHRMNFPYVCLALAVVAMPWDAVCKRPHVDQGDECR